jgi:hypothetical protein
MHRLSVSRTIVMLLLSTTAGCASAMSDKQAGQPCTRTDQCVSGLICSGGACAANDQHPTTARDAQVIDEDAGTDAVGK